MDANLQTDVVRPAEGFGRPSKEIDIEKSNSPAVDARDSHSDSDAKSVESEKFQNGVQRVRAITEIWDKKTLIAMFIFLYLIEFVAFLQNAVDASLNPYITSSFDKFGLLNVGNVMSSALAGCIPLATSKVIDVWGRVEGFFAMLCIVVVGMALKAGCHNMETYVAGHVLYWAGHIGVLYVTDVMAADITSLKNRMIIYTINGTPRIASTFAGPEIAMLFLEESNWRWAFGTFIIVFVACSLPAMGIMVYMYRQAKTAGVIQKVKSDRTIMQSLWYYFVQFDFTGILLIMFAFCLFLLPFTLQSYAPNGWNTGYIIAMIVLGILLFPVFVYYEAKIAPVQFLPWKYLKDRTIVGSCLLYGVMFLAIFVWNAYFYSYILVVHRQPTNHAGYIVNSFSLASSTFSPFFAWIISYTGNFKWTAYTGVPVVIIGTALIIPFRSEDTAPGVLALSQVIVGIGTGIFATCAQLAAMVPVTHQEIAAVSALWGLFGSFGSSIGSAIAGAMWNDLVPKEMAKRLPEASKANATAIFRDIEVTLSYADGTPERDAIVGAYSYVMRNMVIVGVALIPLCLASIFIWRNINIKKQEEEEGKQTKGTIF
ncbi:hypothetical protein NX059_008159 [Plenodomus lindquistii]|nr:hypothetical protein NX059_008159 [Plenodomus lindquistii]